MTDPNSIPADVRSTLMTEALAAHRHAMAVFDAAEANDLVATLGASAALVRCVAEMQSGLKLMAAMRAAEIRSGLGLIR